MLVSVPLFSKLDKLKTMFGLYY